MVEDSEDENEEECLKRNELESHITVDDSNDNGTQRQGEDLSVTATRLDRSKKASAKNRKRARSPDDEVEDDNESPASPGHGSAAGRDRHGRTRACDPDVAVKSAMWANDPVMAYWRSIDAHRGFEEKPHDDNTDDDQDENQHEKDDNDNDDDSVRPRRDLDENDAYPPEIPWAQQYRLLRMRGLSTRAAHALLKALFAIGSDSSVQALYEWLHSHCRPGVEAVEEPTARGIIITLLAPFNKSEEVETVSTRNEERSTAVRTRHESLQARSALGKLRKDANLVTKSFSTLDLSNVGMSTVRTHRRLTLIELSQRCDRLSRDIRALLVSRTLPSVTGRIEQDTNNILLDLIWPTRGEQPLMTMALSTQIRNRQLKRIKTATRAGRRWHRIAQALGTTSGLMLLLDPTLPDSTVERQSESWCDEFISLIPCMRPSACLTARRLEQSMHRWLIDGVQPRLLRKMDTPILLRLQQHGLHAQDRRLLLETPPSTSIGKVNGGKIPIESD